MSKYCFREWDVSRITGTESIMVIIIYYCPVSIVNYIFTTDRSNVKFFEQKSDGDLVSLSSYDTCAEAGPGHVSHVSARVSVSGYFSPSSSPELGHSMVPCKQKNSAPTSPTTLGREPGALCPPPKILGAGANGGSILPTLPLRAKVVGAPP